jgi:hypothetical protein
MVPALAYPIELEREMRVLAGLICAVTMVCGPAAGQTSANPILEHYRGYRAALDRGDLATAETEAEAALAASDARDGDGGRTGVLALNLATVRLQSGDAAGALAPAQRAYALAQAGVEGVDASLAELVLGRAELGTQGQSGATRLRAMFATTGRALAPTEAFLAATELALWSLRRRDYELSRFAWSVAGANAAGSALGEAYGLGQSRTGEAAAIIMGEVARGRRERMRLNNARDAHRLLMEAQQALRPLADAQAANLELTLAQRAYAEAMAWRFGLRAKMRSDDQTLPAETLEEAQGDADFGVEFGPRNLTLPRCLLRVRANPTPTFPSEELDRGAVGAVVMRLRVSATGEVVESRAVAYAGSEGFVEATERVAGRWTVTRRDDSAPNCRMETTVLLPVSFVMA